MAVCPAVVDAGGWTVPIGPPLRCQRSPYSRPCGCASRSAGRNRKTFDAALGPVILKRAYFHYRPSVRIRVPRDAALGA